MKKQTIDELQIELSELETNYAKAFEAGENPYVLNDIWKQIKLLKKFIEILQLIH